MNIGAVSPHPAAHNEVSNENAGSGSGLSTVGSDLFIDRQPGELVTGSSNGSGAKHLVDCGGGGELGGGEFDAVDVSQGGFAGQPLIVRGSLVENEGEVEAISPVPPRPLLSLVKVPVPPVIPPVEAKVELGEMPVKPAKSSQVKAFPPIQVEWKAEWRSTSKNRRPLVRRLYRKQGNCWIPVTRAEVESGLVKCEGQLIVTLHKFTPAAAERVERKGKDAIRQLVQFYLDQSFNRIAG